MTALASGTLLGGNLEIRRVLGQGGFGITYLAHDRDLDLEVVIKEFFPSAWTTRSGMQAEPKAEHAKSFAHFLARFLDEARIAARIEHASLVRVSRYFTGNGTGYFVMPWYQGQTLTNEVVQRGRLPLDRIRDLVLPILDGLEHLHGHGLIHRDVKPDNILITRVGAPILLDFGAVRVCSNSVSGPMTAVLSPGYAPPEQYSETGKQGPHSDVYAVGAVLYWLLSGSQPADAMARAMNAGSSAPIQEQLRGFGVTGRIADLVASAMDLRPDRRIGNVAELRQRMLQAFQAAPKTLHAGWVFGFVALAIVLAGGLYMALGAATDPADEPPTETAATEPVPPPADPDPVAVPVPEDVAPSFSLFEDSMQVGHRGAILRSRPSTQSVTLGRLQAGSIVRIEERIEGEEISNTTSWYRVTTGEELSGYVSASLLEPISAPVQFQPMAGSHREAIARSLGCTDTENREITFADLDLDGRAPEETIVSMLYRDTCGSAGCDGVYVQAFDARGIAISDTLYCSYVELGAAISRGMRDLICVQSYTGIRSIYELAWDGARYQPVSNVGEDDMLVMEASLCALGNN